MTKKVFDYTVVGSGFGGSVSAMRLAEKGYDVVVLERGKRWDAKDFPKSNWNIPKFLWHPLIRAFGIFQITMLNDVMVLHGSGVGGGSLVYANVLMEPSEELFQAPGWSDLEDWQTKLRPHYDTAKFMLGVNRNPRLGPADKILQQMSKDYGREETFTHTNVAVFFGEEGKTVPDPYFDGEGPDRAGCTFCGGCMVGCQHNSKNTLDKNYLYFAEKWGAEVRAEAEVIKIEALPEGQTDGARYEVTYRKPTNWFWNRRTWSVRTKNVVVSAHVLGTLKLLFNARDIDKTLPKLSQRLGDDVRTNSETITGATSKLSDTDYSTGVSIASMFALDDKTRIEAVRYPKGSGFIRMLAMPMLYTNGGFWRSLLGTLWEGIRRPYDFLYVKFLANWSKLTTFLLIMQTEDSKMEVRQGRNLWTGFRRGLTSKLNPGDSIKPPLEMSRPVVRDFADRVNGVPQDSIPEALMGVPTTAHLIGGVPMGRSDEDGVVNKYGEVFNYPGMYVVDGSIMPANPGINPSLTITALAEWVMSHIKPKNGEQKQMPFGYPQAMKAKEQASNKPEQELSPAVGD